MAVPKILIVEDESIVAMGIEHRLHQLGYQVAGIADSGSMAIEQIRENHPDLALMDIQLKEDMDGIEAAQYIRNHFNIPVVFLTAHADTRTLQRAKITEPFGYITKPFQERDLYTTIEMALYKHKMDSKLAEREQWLHTILHSIGDAVIATNTGGQVVFMNPTAETLTGWAQSEAVGRSINAVFTVIDGDTGQPVENLAAKAMQTGRTISFDALKNPLLVTKTNGKTPIVDTVAPIMDDQGRISGAVLVFHDISERKQAEEEREKLLAQLQEAMATLKILSGIIPICASCKKIRDDEGDWHPPEVYITHHSEAQFSHGICPDCAKRLYPGFYQD
jgi:PAS domain S-box-containing protein